MMADVRLLKAWSSSVTGSIVKAIRYLDGPRPKNDPPERCQAGGFVSISITAARSRATKPAGFNATPPVRLFRNITHPPGPQWADARVSASVF